MSLVAALVLLGVGFVCLKGATIAYYAGTHSDGYPFDLPLQDVGPFILGIVISAGLVLLIACLNFSRIHNFISARRQSR